MAAMGVLYDVLFKPIGCGDGGGGGGSSTATVGDQTPAPEWVLHERDGGSLVWRRYGGPAAPHGRRRVEFLDAVEVRVFERDDHGDAGSADADDDAARDADAEDDADDGQQLCWADDWCWDEWDDDAGGKKLFCRRPGGPDDYPVLVAVSVSVTVLGLCFGLAYLFAPVRWLFHQLVVD